MTPLVSLLTGLALGSFANVSIARLPAGRSLIHPGSACLRCNAKIRWFDNIPLLSFLLLRGRCRGCRQRISWQYPLVEFIMGTAFPAIALFHAGSPVRMVISQFLFFIALTVAVIDARHRIIPDEMSFLTAAGGLAVAVWNPFMAWKGIMAPLEAVISGLGAGAGMLAMAWLGEKLFRKEALGGGDIKWMAGIGTVLGWQGAFMTLLAAAFSGGAVGGALILLKRKKLGETIPFGPFLGFGALVVSLWPSLLANLIFP